MKANTSLIAASSLLTLFGSTAAQAEEIALNFDLDPGDRPEPQGADAASPAALEPSPNSGPAPLPVPAGAGKPPMRSHSPSQLPGGVYRRAVATSLNAGHAAATLLPPAPPLYGPPATAVARSAQPKESPQPETETPKSNPDQIALTFEVTGLGDFQIAEATPAPAPAPPVDPLASIFEGGSDSLVARAVGSAEGTRTPAGAITAAYYGHTDPGNGVWNMGTFSYQHGAKNATEADRKQLQRLQSQTQVLKRRAVKHGLNLNLEETLNGIDLANQSPLASIGRVGYIERLVEARNMGHTGFDAIVVARTRSYINPDTQRWNAPGLGNTLESITRDQQRRANAVAKAIEFYQQNNPQIAWENWALLPSENTAIANNPEAPPSEQTPAPEDILFSLWTDGNETKQQTPTLASTELPAAQPQTHPVPNEDTPPATSKPGLIDKVASNGITQLLEALQPEMTDSDQPVVASAPMPSDNPALDTEASDGSDESQTALALPDLDASSDETQTQAVPTWIATRERNQSTLVDSATGQVSPLAPSSETRQSQSDTDLPSQEAQDQNLQLSPSMTSLQVPGATPDTTVLAPLRDDLEPMTIPGLADPEEPENFPGHAPPKTSTPLPEGMLQQLKAQVVSVKEDPAAGFAAVRDQLTEKILEVDLSKPR